MAKREPRPSLFFGTVREAHKRPNGTWIEDESFCYPKGGFKRWAYVLHKGTGEFVFVKCSIPDTYYSIPAKFRDRRKTVNGFVSGNDAGLTFTPYT